VRTFYTSSSRPLPGTGRTASGRHARPLPCRSAHGRPRAYGPPAMRRQGDVVGRWRASPLDADRLSGTERRQPRCAPRSRQWSCWQDTRRFSPWSGSGIGGPGLTPPDPAKCQPGSRGRWAAGRPREAGWQPDRWWVSSTLAATRLGRTAGIAAASTSAVGIRCPRCCRPLLTRTGRATMCAGC
jgi:hypothetical protein